MLSIEMDSFVVPIVEEGYILTEGDEDDTEMKVDVYATGKSSSGKTYILDKIRKVLEEHGFEVRKMVGSKSTEYILGIRE